VFLAARFNTLHIPSATTILTLLSGAASLVTLLQSAVDFATVFLAAGFDTFHVPSATPILTLLGGTAGLEAFLQRRIATTFTVFLTACFDAFHVPSPAGGFLAFLGFTRAARLVTLLQCALLLAAFTTMFGTTSLDAFHVPTFPAFTFTGAAFLVTFLQCFLGTAFPAVFLTTRLHAFHVPSATTVLALLGSTAGLVTLLQCRTFGSAFGVFTIAFTLAVTGTTEASGRAFASANGATLRETFAAGTETTAESSFAAFDFGCRTLFGGFALLILFSDATNSNAMWLTAGS
jgi:hypothetical protein